MTGSPFKFLDAYERTDQDIFFGREEEIARLYRMIGESRVVLVYGESGTGKTSLIQCGLATRLSDTDCFQLFVRRGDDINAALAREIRAEADTPIPPEMSPVDALKSLFLDHLRPMYLIFDQFEELFILGSRDEQEAFFATVADILASDVSCKMIFSLREEYLAQLYRFEEVVPNLFNKRLRVEAMSPGNIEKVITGTTTASDIALERGDETARRIADKIGDERGGVQLAYLQVYLDKLYQEAAGSAGGGPLMFTDASVESTGALGDIMADFVDDRTKALQKQLATSRADMMRRGVRFLLEEFVTVEGTKLPLTRAELLARAPAFEPWLDDAIASLETSRVLRNVDGRYELAHDALAGRIAETRSAARKNALEVKKIVRDRMASAARTGVYLAPEELKAVDVSLRQLDAANQRSLLQLGPEEQAFVKKSKSKDRRRRFILWGGVVAAICTILFFIMTTAAAFLLQEDERLFTNYSNDAISTNAYYQLLYATDQDEVWSVRRNILYQSAAANQRRDTEADTVMNPAFWMELFEAQAAWDSNNDDLAHEMFDVLETELVAALDENPANWDARIRYRALLSRRFQNSAVDADITGQRSIGARLVGFMQEDGFDDDIAGQLAPEWQWDIMSACKSLQENNIVIDECTGVDLSALEIANAEAS
ncbi:ATP-binding protein [Pacificimonas sp. WHA3]|uniref:ATP-binding protein n=1 Tax=Pacificimonas pallii TaxID=2827236 RepID=A0ABS6SBQ6_9SPHN|nr:ATP-binding protein [Pacificimonas pallii]MBV7255852.1 ATP-binding protein [Pacificimonas pallii]